MILRSERALRVSRDLLGWARWPAIAVLGLGVLLWLVLFAPRLLVPPLNDASVQDVPDPAKRHELQDGRLKLENDVRTTLFQALGGAVVLAGAYITWRQLKLSREQLQHNLQATREQRELDRQGQITERFTRAIDQLGSDKTDVVLGGIYALERIARDSTHDQGTIGEILCAFVREHAPWPPSRPGQYVATAPLDSLPDLQRRAPAIQAILAVLDRGGFATQMRLDLGQTDLRRARLAGANLERTNLLAAHLEGANLRDAHLKGAVLADAQLERAFVRGAVLENADLSGAHLEAADLERAHLSGTLLFDTHLEGANLRYANLGGADLQPGRVVRFTPKGDHLSLKRPNLCGPHLEGAILAWTDLEDANLSGTDLARVNLRNTRLKGAIADATTIWPAAFDWRAAGVTMSEARSAKSR